MSNLPTGTVTFLFTDIEGSAALAQQYPSALPALLARHHALLREGIARHRGHIFQIVGDAFCVAFWTAGDALNAALDAQRSLQNAAWDSAPIKVRMGLHTGPAEAGASEDRAGGYAGYLTLMRVQRVMSVAHGGQVLLSTTTAELLRGQLPDDVTLRDMGAHRLKGMLNPELLWQLVAPGMQQDFPPLPTLDAIPNNLPGQITSFVGRQREITQVAHLLTTAHLLTLTGPGGTGKTRLALQAAAELLDSFTDGAWLVELAPISDRSLVAQSIASVFRLRELPGRPLEALLADALRDKHLLLVLDNCEHLIDECARICDLLLRACPELRILASSRESLGIAGETVLRVPSLAIPDLQALPPLDELVRFEAVQLFAERARSVQPDFQLTSQNAYAVAQISCRLDGIPLALELAAARVRTLSPEQIAVRLDDRFRLLTGGSRAAVQRQQTLQALIDWSYDLLTPSERILLRRLAVFSGGWTLEEVEGVCSWGDLAVSDLLDLLDRLVNKSLVNADGGEAVVRYRMQETIRQYAQDKLLAAGEATEARTKHLAYFAAEAAQAAPQWRTPERARRLRWTVQEQGNLRAAVAWALESDLDAAMALIYDLCWYWPMVGSPQDSRRLVTRALAQVEAQPEAWYGQDVDARHRLLLAGAWFADGLLANASGMSADTRNSMEKAIALLAPLGQIDRLAPAYSFAGLGAVLSGSVEAGAAYVQKALTLARQAGDRWAEAMQHITLGMIGASAARSVDGAFAELEEGTAIMRELGDVWGEAMGHMVAGNTLLRSGDLSMAQRHYEQSVPLFDEAGYVRMANVSRSGLADIARLQGDHARARALYPPVIQEWQLVGNRGAIARCLECLGFVADAQASAAPDPLPLLRHAATLYGAADAIRRTNRTPMSPWEQDEYDRHTSALRGMLDPDEFAAAWREGQSMTLDQAVAYATKESAR